MLAIHEQLTAVSVRFASNTIDRITARGEALEDCPESGRVVSAFDLPNLRELIVSPYRVMYLVSADRIEIIAVLHGARRLR